MYRGGRCRVDFRGVRACHLQRVKIYAEVCGYGSTCDAYHVTAPNPDVGASSKTISTITTNGMDPRKSI